MVKDNVPWWRSSSWTRPRHVPKRAMGNSGRPRIEHVQETLEAYEWRSSIYQRIRQILFSHRSRSAYVQQGLNEYRLIWNDGIPRSTSWDFARRALEETHCRAFTFQVIFANFKFCWYTLNMRGGTRDDRMCDVCVCVCIFCFYCEEVE